MQSNQNSFINLIAKDGFSVVFGRFYGAMDKASKSATNMGSSVRNAFASFAVGGAAYKATSTIVNLNLEFDRINRTLAFATRSSQDGAKAFGFIREESRRLGLDLKTTAASYAQFSAAARGTALEGEKAREIFSAVSSAATVLGLDAYSTRGALRALEQMISKGNVQAEELRQQLGERLPGAFEKAARAMDVTTSELNDMLENGEVLAEELLPKLAKVLNQDFGSSVEEAAASLRAEINRFRTELDLMINNVDKITGFSAAFEGIVEILGGAANAFNEFVEAGEAASADKIRRAPYELQQAINLVRQEIEELESAGGANFYQVAFKYDTLERLLEGLEIAKKQAADLEKGMGAGRTERQLQGPPMPPGMQFFEEIPKSDAQETLDRVFGFIEEDIKKRKKRVETAIEAALTPAEAFSKKLKEIQADLGGEGGFSIDEYTKVVSDLAQKYAETSKAGKDARAAAEALKDEQEDAQRVIESIMTPQEMYRAEVAKLSELYSKGHLGVEQYSRAIKALKDEVVDLLPETKAANDAQEELQQIFDSLKTPAEKYADQIIRIIELFKTLKDSNKDAFDALGGEEGMTALIMRAAEAQTAATTKLQEQADKASRMAMQNVAVVLNATSQQVSALSGAFEEGGKAAKAFFVMSQALAAANAIISGLSASMSIREAYAKLAAQTANPTLATVGEVHANLAAVMGFATAGMIAGQTIASFEGGGYTGSGARAGGMDGKGGMLAMVHPNETIIDHEKNGKMAQPVNVNFTIQANDTKDFDRLLVERRGVIVSLINNAVNNRGRRLVE